MIYLAIFLLLCCSFFFSGTETAITAVSTPLLYEQKKKGNQKAATLLDLKEKPSILIGSLLLGNNLVNIALTALTTGLCIEVFGPNTGVVIATFGVSFIVLVFSEILPKTYALSNTLNMALYVAPLTKLIVFVFTPFVLFLNWVSSLSMKVLHMKPANTTSEEEIRAELRGAIALPSENVLPEERTMMHSVLELSDVQIEDVMIHRSHITSLNINTPIKEVFKFIAESPHTRIPIWENKTSNIIGVIHTKELLKTLTKKANIEKISIKDLMTPPWFVLENTSLLNQLIAFRKRKEHFALVVDEYGSLQGLVTLQDILEDIVGDINDETDTPEEVPSYNFLTATGAYRLKGSTSIRDLNRHLHWNLPDTEASTLAGYLMYETECIPSVGQKFIINGFCFTVVGKEKNKLTLIDVLPNHSKINQG